LSDIDLLENEILNFNKPKKEVVAELDESTNDNAAPLEVDD
jgi:hypothetical protein